MKGVSVKGGLCEGRVCKKEVSVKVVSVKGGLCEGRVCERRSL